MAAALRLARGLEPGTDRERALLGLANTHQAAGRLEEAVRAAETMDDGGMKAVTLSRLANRFAEAGRLDRAAELLSESLSVIRRAEDDQGLTYEFLRELVVGELRHDFEAVSPRTETLKGALARLFEAGRAGAAADVLAQVRELALDPDRDALDAARLLACASRLYAKSDGAKAAELLSEALAAVRRAEDDGDRYAEAGRKEAALDAWGQAYEAARAVKLRKSDYEPCSSIRGDSDKLRLLSALVLRLIRAGEYERAPEFARDMRAVQAAALALTRGGTASVREADAYVAGLAEELTRAGQKESALAVLAEAGNLDEKPGQNIDPFSRATALATVGAAYAKAEDRARAAVYLRRALQLADGNEDYSGQEKYWVLVAIGARYAEAGMRPDTRARKSLRRLVRGMEEDKE